MSSDQINKPFPDSKQAWEIVGIFMTSTILMAIIALPLKSLLVNFSLISIIYSFIPGAITIGYILIKNVEILKHLVIDFETNQWHRYISFLLIVTGIVLIYISLLSIIKISSIPLRMEIIRTISRFVSLKMFFAVVIIAPVYEEFIFRGIVLNGFLTRMSPLKAIMLSSLLFSIFHINPFQFLTAFLLGLFAGWYYFKTRNLLSCIIIHSLSNLVGFLFIMYFEKKASAIKYKVDESLFLNHSLLLFFFIAIAIVVIGYLGLKSSFSRNPGESEVSNS